MNNLLELKGKKFEQQKRIAGGSISMNGNFIVTVEHIKKLEQQLKEIKDYWKDKFEIINGVLISVYYNKIAAKSNRIKGIFKGKDSNRAIVGSKFNAEKNKHIITYFLEMKDLERSIDMLSKGREIVDKEFNGGIDIFALKNINTKFQDHWQMKKSVFQSLIADVSYIDLFNVDKATPNFDNKLITIYDVKQDVATILQKLGIYVLNIDSFDNLTINLNEDAIKELYEKAPYLVNMGVENLSKLDYEDFAISSSDNPSLIIVSPTNEPTIGVIDTLFDKNSYFSEWVDYEEMVSPEITKAPGYYEHGTAVSSIIVDGPALNPNLDDGCGRFKVKHFGIYAAKNLSMIDFLKKLKIIIARYSNKIRVWNISLGSRSEINDNYVSLAAYELDKIQSEYNVIFVISGTNKPKDINGNLKIGSPADSINSIVVNSVRIKDKNPASYSRRGPVLSYFLKPDVSYYGGDYNFGEEITVYSSTARGLVQISGTSFAAPWVARKLSYLIDVLGQSREVAKALIIDSARKWSVNIPSAESALLGHGIVPIHINDILYTKDDEIKFVVSDVSREWNTYNYEFPVPLVNQTYPYIAKVIMCYFPKCNRNQGVDYTNTEFDLHFGRVKKIGDGKYKIEDIKNNKQNQDNDPHKIYTFEETARKEYRKWDNVKFIAKDINKKNQALKWNETMSKNWGLEIKTSNRLDAIDGLDVKFGAVITLKALDGKNRIDEFIKNCHFNGWIINKIDVENRINIYEKAEEKIDLK
ncbi:S8 family peptidase [Mycoplasma phocoeninasale]|uniref:S8 family peptidase n=1 Tax=Mycoplasma phocoeninasale TaxID=2726117 RepID=A0A858U4P9_9MOLU|nr:S8 family peptidase [Mycoplasma phocoeninasale]QJG66377.1 S8 family peptidase [Mycoplasma phocoeninasale]